MQSLPIPAPASSSAHPGLREEAPAATRRDEGFAERLQERAPKERRPAGATDKADKPEKAERPSKAPRPTTDKVSDRPVDDAPETDVVEAPVDVPAVDPSDIHVPVTTTVITPGSTLAEALLALVGTTSAAIDPTQTTTSDQDPLLAALATLLGELPDAQALPTPGTVNPTATTAGTAMLDALPAEDAQPIVPSLLAMLGPQPATTTEGEAAADAAADAVAVLTSGAAMTSTGPTKTTVSTTTDTAIAAGLADSLTTTAPTGMQTNADGAGDHAAQQAPAPAVPLATASAPTDEDTPFTIAEPRAAGETAVAKPAAAPVARPAPEAGNPMERAVANQVSRALIRESADGSRMISLRLTPPELGTVRIDIVERAGVMTARLHAEDAGVRVALERYLPQLRQDLLSHNAPVRELQLADAWAGDLTRQNHGDQQGRTGNRRSSRSSFSLDGVAAVPAGLAAPAMTASTITADSVDARA